MSSHDTVIHGGLDFAELETMGLKADAVIDFSTNVNPYGTSLKVKTAIAEVLAERYPDRESMALRRAIASHLSVSPDEVCVGNGSAELIHAVALAFFSKGESILILKPTFGEYERATRLAQAVVHFVQAQAENDFRFNPQMVSEMLHTEAYRAVFICNPNNPTGQMIDPQILMSWIAQFPKTLFVIDEAYHAFAEGAPTAVSFLRENVLVLRSMTKDYALAAYRLGYAVGSKAMMHRLSQFLPPWNVNAVAQSAGVEALQDSMHLTKTLEKINIEKKRLVQKLKELGYSPLDSETNYFLIPVENGTVFRQRLLLQKILVRDCASFGLPQYIRIATRTAVENDALVAAMKKA